MPASIQVRKEHLGICGKELHCQMFIEPCKRAGYDRAGAQFAYGRFLILMQPSDAPTIFVRKAQLNPSTRVRGLVRYVRMSQIGQFMMGRLRMKGTDGVWYSISLSGTYGNDGLIRQVPRRIWERGIELPNALFEQWATGAGTEAESMRTWAHKHYTK